MGILLPENIDWSPAHWISRGLFDDLLELDGLPAGLAAEACFCVDAQLDTLDLRGATPEDLRSLRGAVVTLLSRVEAREETSFQRPEYYPTYVAWLRELAAYLRRLGGDQEPDEEANDR